MTLDELITLTKAGYTKEEIQAMTTPAAPETPAQPADPEPETPAAPEKPAEPAAPAQNQDTILEALNRLTNSIINHNINGTVTQPAVRTPEDALAEIIAPPRKNKEV